MKMIKLTTVWGYVYVNPEHIIDISTTIGAPTEWCCGGGLPGFETKLKTFVNLTGGIKYDCRECPTTILQLIKEAEEL